MDEVARYRKLLRPVEDEAKGQRWANERPWHTKTHVWNEDGVVVVDLHDLGAGIARKAVQLLLDVPAERGAIVLIHGRGRHSVGASQVLRNVVHKELKLACGERADWSFRMVGAGRTAWISDRKRAPRSVTGEWGLGTWVWLTSLAAAVAASLGHAVGLW
jgi:hypothetical protein